jgi:hypothetical protein
MPPPPPCPVPPPVLAPNGRQKPTLQNVFAPHVVQLKPPEPHANSDVPASHAPDAGLQQPAHVAVVHFGGAV